MRTPLRLPTLLVLATAALASACASGGGHKFHDANMDFGSVKVVAVLPFGNLSRDSAGAERVRDVFANMLLASGSIYVLPNGEVARGLSRLGVANPINPSPEEITKLGGLIKCDAVIGGVVKEYGEVRSGSASANVVSASVQMFEASSGRVIWSASSTKGGLTMMDRMFGGGGAPVNDVTESLVNDLLDRLFKQ
ncbi:GNA1162 family protein [Anaeromyxobacter paludicola]|uniref:Lipoprotein n=1 Tax=Anaeromyxobacter paludicola TaxID=2918171 RepID=A0ABN6N7U5_9BACT|nr:GNA1162 family protein [Anaeromyxobacter paludicola]BDG09252.1 lipoprotein [Anaeromyxobacter paludicola]